MVHFAADNSANDVLALLLDKGASIEAADSVRAAAAAGSALCAEGRRARRTAAGRCTGPPLTPRGPPPSSCSSRAAQT
jgi:hypothetical protein